MKKTNLILQTNALKICKEIEAFIYVSMKNLKRDGAVLGLSGGLDSAVVAMLAVRSLGREKVHALYLPEKDSNPIHRKHAIQYADQLGIQLTVRSISPVLRATKTYTILPLGAIPGRKLRSAVVDFGRRKLLEHNDERIFVDRLDPNGNSWLEKGNAYGMAKHRVRMALIYQYAELNNLMVMGAANRTELLTGTFCKWGVDHCSDIMPVLHIFRSQLEEMADYLEIPAYIRNKPSDPDLYPTKIDKGDFLGGFKNADQILFNLENKVDKKDLYAVYDQKIVDHVFSLFKSSEHMRNSPLHL